MEKTKEIFCPAAVIFDMDGLMLNTERMSIPVWEKAGKIFGYNISEEIVLRTVGVSDKNSRVIMLEEFGRDFPYEKIRDEFRLIFREELTKEIPHKPGLVYLLDRLATAKIPHGVATSTRKATALEMLNKAGILDRFASITGGDEIENGKPAPDIFLLAAERLGQPPSACVGLEDSPAGLRGLHSAGIRSVFIKDIIEPPQDVLADVWRRCNDLAEVAQLFGL
jgi:HAD superfamily hydrolase (TIGR01509 family)